jgi:hypothetical protein
MHYRLKFINSVERTVRDEDVDAPDDEAAIVHACNRSILYRMAIELCDGERPVIRVTPMTARLYLPDRSEPRL